MLIREFLLCPKNFQEQFETEIDMRKDMNEICHIHRIDMKAGYQRKDGTMLNMLKRIMPLGITLYHSENTWILAGMILVIIIV